MSESNKAQTETVEEMPALLEQIEEMQEQISEAEQELDAQQQIAFAVGVFQANVTVRTLLESLAEGVVIVDRKGRILLFNHQAEELFGYTAEAIQGKRLTVLLPLLYENVHDSHLESFFKNPQPRSMGAGMDLTARRSNGEEFPVEVSLSHLETEVGIFGLAYVTDISLRKKWEWDLQARNQELDAFAHMVAHDLKGSLSILTGFGDFLRAEYANMSGAEIKEILDTIVNGGHKMNSIINELLLFAGLRNEQVESKPLDNAEIVHDALLRLRAEMDKNGSRVEVPDELIRALGYGPWLEEVWFNYLSNAIKYGGNPPIIRVGSENQGPFVRFLVTDNGSGLTTEQQLGLFEPFARRHSGVAQGHGLGLSIVKRIVTKLGGTVGVESTPGKGSTFYFTLPAIDSTE